MPPVATPPVVATRSHAWSRPFITTTPAASQEKATYTLRQRSRVWVVHQKLVILSFIGDLTVIVLGLLGAYLLRFDTSLQSLGVEHDELQVGSYLPHFIFGCLLMIFLLGNFRLHDPRNFLSLQRNIAVILKSAAIWFAGFLGLSLAFKLEPQISRIYCMIAAIVMAISLCAWRWLLHSLFRREPVAAALRQKVLFVGWNQECAHAAERMRTEKVRKYDVLGVIKPSSGAFDDHPGKEIRVLGNFKSLRRILRESSADILMVVDGATDRVGMVELSETCGKEFVDFKIVPSCFQVLVSGLDLESVHGLPVLGIGKLPLHHVFNNLAKRLLDILGAIIGLIVFAPVMAFFALLVYLESPGPVLYRQRRVGLNGRPFNIIKIRSMKPDAEQNGKPGWTVHDDPRRLRVGAFMRAWNIDELPQFWNVLKGEMSLVGPRPERPELIEDFKEEIPYYNVRHHIKPGVTGWAQVNGLRGDTCLRKRIKFDLDYIENWNFIFDIKIMLMTLLSRKGAC